ncbi:aldo/keto reductase [candidate division GN15 bacterium]|nr:aldo/keto reductase [candidate division GN15 bacterium]
MNYRQVGKTGLKISEISLGAWLTYGNSVEAATAETIIKAAVDNGINFIDIADIYAKGKAEEVVGKAIKDMKRSDLVISSKVFWPMSDNVNDRGLSRKHIMESIDKSLQRIGTDYLDIYYCHRYDEGVPVDETVRAMSDLVQQGKVLYWGTSVWDAEQIEQAIGAADKYLAYRPSVEQPRYNMLDRHIEDRVVGTCKRHGMGLTVWSPLGQGLLTGKYNDGVPKGTRGGDTMWLAGQLTEENIDKVRKLTAVANDLGVKVSQLALAWILRLKEISSAITGATKVEQLKENIAATDINLDDEILKKIDEILGDSPDNE